jgi:hypothetical protein
MNWDEKGGERNKKTKFVNRNSLVEICTTGNAIRFLEMGFVIQKKTKRSEKGILEE